MIILIRRSEMHGAGRVKKNNCSGEFFLHSSGFMKKLSVFLVTELELVIEN